LINAKEPTVKDINFAMIGHGFMGKAHSYALLATPFFFESGIQPVRKVICGRNPVTLQAAAENFGWEETSTDWRATIQRDDIDAVTIVTPPNTHAEIIVAAAEAGKHIFCEKPFTATVEQAEHALAAVQQAGIKHMLGFNYRRVPAIGLAHQLIESGRLGEIYHFRAAYLQDWIMDPQFPRIWKLHREVAGSGPHHELNSHIIDLALYLVGDIRRVVGIEETFVKERPAPAISEQLSTMLTAEATSTEMLPVDVDDTTAFLARFACGAVGTFESTRFAAGRRNHNRIEVNGSRGSVYFDLEKMNQLNYYNVDDPADVPGFRTIQVNEGCHPYIDHWWPPGHGIGYQNTFVNQYADFLLAIANDTVPEPGFEVGWKNQVVLDAVTRSIAQDGWENINA
jgi:predicted dehydrogenase